MSSIGNEYSRPLQQVQSSQQSTSVTTATDVQNYVQSQSQGTISTSQEFKAQQAEILNLLQSLGFNKEQAQQLSGLSQLQGPQLARTLMMAQAIMNHEEMFADFVKNFKNILARGQHTQEGIKNILDAFDRILNTDSKKLAKNIFKNDSDTELVEAIQGDYSKSSKQYSSKKELPFGLTEKQSQDLQKASKEMPKQLTEQQRQVLQEFVKFTHASLEEFPNHFHEDVFAASQLYKKGVSLEDYMKLSSSIPPIRLLNLLVEAEKSGASSQNIIQNLLGQLDQGNNLLEVFKTLEKQYKIDMDPLLAALDLNDFKWLQPVNNNIEIDEKLSLENLALSFVAFDILEGVLGHDKVAVLAMPNQLEYLGSVFALKEAPLGVLYFILAGLTKKNEVIQRWLRFQWKGKKQDFKNKKEQAKHQEDEKNSQKNTGEKSLSESLLSDLETKPKRAVEINFSGAQDASQGPFLGQIFLPLDYAKTNPQDLVLDNPESGIVLTAKDYLRGNYPHYGVMFRFLANYIEPTDKYFRHALINLKPSDIFEEFNHHLKAFMSHPNQEWEKWKVNLAEFFKRLSSVFPQGEKTFSVAERMFEVESEAFKDRRDSSGLYKNLSLEEQDDAFITACYAKGSYSLAVAGDVTGALTGLSFASLVNFSDSNSKAVLGEYLDYLKKRHYHKSEEDKYKNYYSSYATRGFGENIRANSYYEGLGKEFLNAVSLRLPEKTETSLNQQIYKPSY